MAKKERDIVRLLYEENKEYTLIRQYVMKHIRDNAGCHGFGSRKIFVETTLPINSFGNMLCDYIDYLHNRSKYDKSETKEM